MAVFEVHQAQVRLDRDRRPADRAREPSHERRQESIVVERPIEEVFAYLTDPETLPEWQTTVLAVRLETDGPMGPGSRIEETRKFLGRRLDVTMEVLEYDAPQRFALRSRSGPVPLEVTNSLREEGEGTRIDTVIEGEPGGFFRLAETLVARAVERELRSNLETLKDVLESRAGAATA